MRVLLAASEVVGFAKTGGLADVAGSLPRALAERGHECAVILPLYRCARLGKIPVQRTEHILAIPVGKRTVKGRLWKATLPGSAVPVYLVDQPEYFDRDDPKHGRGLYQFTQPGGRKADYADNCERFIFFCRAVLEALPLIGFWPQVLHANDWQTGLLPVYLREEYARHPRPARRDAYERVRTLFTIHNILYQGVFWHWDMLMAGLDWKLFNYEQLEYHGLLSLLKAGIVFSDLVNTVSPTYAREIQTPFFGEGMQGVLVQRRNRLFGIMNGVDYNVWDPARDSLLAANYDPATVTKGKALCKIDVQKHFGLAQQPRTPLLAVIARLVEQKGVELIVQAASALLRQDTQLVVLGEGDPAYHKMLEDLKTRFPDRVGLLLGFDEALAHRIEAGADLFLMPSLFEPSGLNQLYSMKYGTVPVVRATGGLADSVVDCTPDSLAAGKTTGFSFGACTAEALLETVQRALKLYRDQPDNWLRLMRTGMNQDWSWNRSAAEYEQLYERMAKDE